MDQDNVEVKHYGDNVDGDEDDFEADWSPDGHSPRQGPGDDDVDDDDRRHDDDEEDKGSKKKGEINGGEQKLTDSGGVCSGDGRALTDGGVEGLPEGVTQNELNFVVRQRPRNSPAEPRVGLGLVKKLMWILQIRRKVLEKDGRPPTPETFDLLGGSLYKEAVDLMHADMRAVLRFVKPEAGRPLHNTSAPLTAMVIGGFRPPSPPPYSPAHLRLQQRPHAATARPTCSCSAPQVVTAAANRQQQQCPREGRGIREQRRGGGEKLVNHSTSGGCGAESLVNHSTCGGRAVVRSSTQTGRHAREEPGPVQSAGMPLGRAADHRRECHRLR